MTELINIAAMAFVGLIVGSFMNVVVYRLPIMIEHRHSETWNIARLRRTVRTASTGYRCVTLFHYSVGCGSGGVAGLRSAHFMALPTD